MGNDKKRASLSCLRVAATLAVVLMHACTTLTDNPDLFVLSQAEQSFFSVLRRMTTWAVPCFLFISGALLLNGDRAVTVRSCLISVRRMLLVLLLFAVPFAVVMEYSATRQLSLSLIPAALVRAVGNNSFSHLWYVYMMIGLYLLLPAVRVFTDHCSRKLLEYVLLVMFAVIFVLPFVSRAAGLPIALALPVETPYLFYLLFGHYIVNCRPEWASRRGLAAAGLLLCGAVIVLYGMREPAGALVADSYSCPVTAVLAACIFILFQGIGGETPKALWTLDRLCFGVYIVHPVFIHLLYRVLGCTPTGALFPLKTVGILCLVTVASFCASRVLTWIRPISKYVL